MVQEESYDRDDQFKDVELSRPNIKLIPASPASAPFVFVFTTFPSVILKFRGCSIQSVPLCGCDACDETAAEEIKRLRQIVTDVVEGRFREVIRVTLSRKASVVWELWSDEGRSSGGSDVKCGKKLLGRGRKAVIDWKPWPRRA